MTNNDIKKLSTNEIENACNEINVKICECENKIKENSKREKEDKEDEKEHRQDADFYKEHVEKFKKLLEDFEKAKNFIPIFKNIDVIDRDVSVLKKSETTEIHCDTVIKRIEAEIQRCNECMKKCSAKEDQVYFFRFKSHIAELKKFVFASKERKMEILSKKGLFDETIEILNDLRKNIENEIKMCGEDKEKYLLNNGVKCVEIYFNECREYSKYLEKRKGVYESFIKTIAEHEKVESNIVKELEKVERECENNCCCIEKQTVCFYSCFELSRHTNTNLLNEMGKANELVLDENRDNSLLYFSNRHINKLSQLKDRINDIKTFCEDLKQYNSEIVNMKSILIVCTFAVLTSNDRLERENVDYNGCINQYAINLKKESITKLESAISINSSSINGCFDKLKRYFAENSNFVKKTFKDYDFSGKILMSQSNINKLLSACKIFSEVIRDDIEIDVLYNEAQNAYLSRDNYSKKLVDIEKVFKNICNKSDNIRKNLDIITKEMVEHGFLSDEDQKRNILNFKVQSIETKINSVGWLIKDINSRMSQFGYSK